MKVKHIWSVLCKESVISQDDNTISLHGVLEDVNSVLTPINKEFKKEEKILIPFTYEIVSYWTKDLVEEVGMDVKIAIIDPNGKELSSAVNISVFPKDVKRLRTRIKIQGLPVSESGRYIFQVNLKTNEDKSYRAISELPLDIKFTIQQPEVKTSN